MIRLLSLDLIAWNQDADRDLEQRQRLGVCLSSNFTSPELDGLDKQRSRVKIFSEGNPNHLTSELDLGPVSRWSERAM